MELRIRSRRRCRTSVLLAVLAAWSLQLCRAEADDNVGVAIKDRSPVDLVLAGDDSWLATANETGDSVSLVDPAAGRVLDEAAVGRQPAAIALCPDGQTLLVSTAHAGEVVILQVADGKLRTQGRIRVGFEPHGIAISPDGDTAYVALFASGQVAVLDLAARAVRRRLDVGKWPRHLALTPDGARLAVGCGGDGKIVVLDTQRLEPLYEERLTGGINLGHMRCSSDGKSVYFPWMVYRTNPITVGNIQRGWVLASRLARVRLDGPAYREALSLDVPRRAVADPYGLALSRDQQRLVASAGGTHELLVYRLPDLPFEGAGGPGDLIDRGLMADRDRFFRVDVGGRPLGLEIAADNRTTFVANYLRNSVQVVDLDAGKVAREISLGGPRTPSLARQGMAIFYDGQRSLDQWYSCHSCHQNGGGNSRPMDTLNDGANDTFKTVLPLYHVTKTKPWTWHGWQTDLSDAMHKSLTTTMLGRRPTDDDVKALLAFLDTLKSPPNPYRQPDGSLTEAASRGRQVFNGSKANCIACHCGPHFTDGEIHDVGLGSPKDRYQGFNTPSLLGVYRRVRLLHHGRGRSLEATLSDLHSPENVSGQGSLSEQEFQDLLEYVKSL